MLTISVHRTWFSVPDNELASLETTKKWCARRPKVQKILVLACELQSIVAFFQFALIFVTVRLLVSNRMINFRIDSRSGTGEGLGVGATFMVENFLAKPLASSRWMVMARILQPCADAAILHGFGGYFQAVGTNHANPVESKSFCHTTSCSWYGFHLVCAHYRRPSMLEEILFHWNNSGAPRA